MLIKKRKLEHLRHTPGSNVIELGETAKLTQLEIQKAKQEARAIRQEADAVLIDSKNKLKDAEERARKIIHSADIEAKELKEKAYRESIEAAEEEVQYLKDEAKFLLKDLFEVKREALTQAHKSIIKIALEIAEKIIKYQVSIDTNVLKKQVIDAIKKATSEADRVQVFVNPQDIKIHEESIPEMEKLFPSGVNIVSLTDESVDPGSCIVETKSGQLDARFSTQLKALVNLMLHLEVQEPQIKIEKEEEILPQEEFEEDEDLTLEEEVEEELQAETQGDVLSEEQDQILEVPDTIADKIRDKKKLVIDNPFERTEEEAKELDEFEEPSFEYEEEVDFNEELEEEFEEEDDDDDDDDEEKQVFKSILKPKKSKPVQISDIASELEESPEWKDLVEDEEE